MKIVLYPGAKDSYTSILDDLKAHTNDVFASADIVTKVHETLHGVNSDIRNKYHSPGFYVLQDKALLLDEPACKLSDVARAVPIGERGPNFSLYLIRMQNYWENQPTYVLDEWSAYRAGYLCAKETGVREEDAYNHLVEFTRYAEALIRVAPEVRPFLEYFEDNRGLLDYGTASYV